jgi:hypothetical protein
MIDQVKQFVALTKLKKQQEEALDETKAKLMALEAELLPQFEANGVDKLKADGMTVFLFSQKWAGVTKDGPEATPEERQRAVQALKDAGLGVYVKEDFNTQSLSAYVREALAQAPLEVQMDPSRWFEVLPHTFEGAISVTEKVSLRTRKS